jgi:hypothetical protein
MGIRILQEDYSTAAAVAVAQVHAQHSARQLHTSSLLAEGRSVERVGETGFWDCRVSWIRV